MRREMNSPAQAIRWSHKNNEELLMQDVDFQFRDLWLKVNTREYFQPYYRKMADLQEWRMMGNLPPVCSALLQLKIVTLHCVYIFTSKLSFLDFF